MSIHPIDQIEIHLERNSRLGFRHELRLNDFPSAIELNAVRHYWVKQHGKDILSPEMRFPKDIEKLLKYVYTRTICESTKRTNSEIHLALSDVAEIHGIPVEADGWEAGSSFNLFQQRFQEKLRSININRKYSYGIVAALEEVASNAVEHSNSLAPAIACYQVASDKWTFSVTDLGRGILASIRDNPNFRTVTSHTEALGLALQDGVSSAPDPGRGYGFSQVFKTLVDRSSRLRFRTGGAVGHWAGTSPTAQTVKLQSLPIFRPGFHVCVSGHPAPWKRPGSLS